ncbi:MAG: DUF3737 family protein [Bacteroidales bacterium]|nr:DUF3737 family protein [Bacteroidales bacterium]
MEIIQDQYFEGERPLYVRHGLRLERVSFGPGESALKEGSNFEATDCVFNGKYPFWECKGISVRDSVFREGARAGLWYSEGCKMVNCLVEAPKMFRRIKDVYLENVKFPNALETLWDCKNVELNDVEVEKGDYLFMHSSDIKVDHLRLRGNYSFQYAKNVVIRNSDLETKDAFWEAENVTVYDSRINGEYLGWYAKNLRLVNCKIGGTQPLCYCDNLVLENCVFEEDADLAFEYSDVEASILGPITSVKNPRTGRIMADSYGDIVLDGNIKAPGDCEIGTWSEPDINLGQEPDIVEF